MELLTFYELEESRTAFQELKDLAETVKREIPCASSILVSEASEALQISLQLCKLNGRDLLGKISVTLNNTVSFCTVLTDTSLFAKCQTNFQTTSIIRYFLKQNSSQRAFSYKIHPISGVFSISKVISFPKLFSQREMIDMMIDNLTELQDLLKQEYLKVLEILNDHSVQCSKEDLSITQSLKVYAQSSPHYTWKALEGKTRGKIADSKMIYEPKKKLFRKKRGHIITNKLVTSISQTFLTSKTELYPFFVLTSSEDQELVEKYLNSPAGFKKNTKIIQKISLCGLPKQSIKDKQTFEVQTKSSDRTEILAQKRSPEQLEYENKILAMLTQTQIAGLPRYFQLENCPEVSSNFSFSNLFDSISFGQLMNSNKKSMSYSTKLYILMTIINTLRYLRDCGVVYNNLRPDTIKIKKGLIPKLTDFTNAYHQFVPPMKDSFKDHFPYVSILKSLYRTHTFEKSDSFSFGALAYYTLFGKTIGSVKGSTMARMSTQRKREIIFHGQTFALENCDNYGGNTTRIFLKMIMDSLKHKEPEDEYLDRTKDEKTGLEQRPYLDWFYITLQIIDAQNANLCP